jgi:cytochrome P450
MAADPYPVYAQLRERCPVARSTAWDGFWVVTDHEHVVAVAQDDDRFCSGQGVALPAIGQARPLLPIESDPPRYTQYRKMLNPRFTRGGIAEFEADIREIVVETIGSFSGRGEADLIKDFAQIVPARSTLRMLGLDEGEYHWFLERIHIGVHESTRDLDRSVEALMEVYVALGAALEDRYDRGAPGGDLISYLAYYEIEGERLSEEEVLDTCLLMLFGGLDTTASLIGEAALHFGRNPQVRDRYAGDPASIPQALEEFLRFASPVQGLARTATCDTELGGQQIKAGDKMWIVWASANRDPAAFPDPDTLDLDRTPNRHVAFGVGIHRCLGSHFGRKMAQIAVEELLARIPDFVVPADAHLPRFEDSSVGYGLLSVPATFTPTHPPLAGANR